ncbi:LamG-like jellyroll fold domain-containing protein [Kitasatospora sp. GP82]|uniref:RHS repeat-associated core domain-containing protein n=1 Tax=Kitasatospora sp. GP82 TaxID=3035089 RepID=UPI00247368AE|nr:LamG-like jellyroll fold domain-containing protein [Kitasatospora sp. GP82]MDH6129274.1 RHS repeat-associated protein [Kitasatospora sp. GP82]
MSQQLYIDGQPSGAPVTGLTRYCGDAYAYLGAGTDNGSPQAPTDISGHFNGSIADFSYYPYAMAASTVANHYTAATGPVGEAVSQSAAYRAAVTLTTPSAYWRLDESTGATNAQDELGTALPNQEHGTYTNTTLGTAGPSGSSDGTAATFNGTTSSVQLPATAAAVQGPNTVELWFKTTTSGTLYGYQSFPLGAAHTNSDSWNPALYVGSDGKLYGDLWTGSASTGLNSSQTVNDGKWHHAVLAADDTGQTLYLDGTQAASSNTARQIWYNGSAYVYVGAGTADGGWPNHPTSTDGHFNGSIAEVAFYKTRLSADQVNAHYKAMGSASSPTKTTYTSVTDPGGRTVSWRWDTATGQLTNTVDATGGNTRYTYDTHGFLYSVTDPNGHTVTTGHDDRGNAVSTTTCTTPASCHTSYASYYVDQVNPFNPKNDHRLTTSDARAQNPNATTYATTYSYSPTGDLTSTQLPATTDFPNGRTSTVTYTAGTEPAVGTGGTEPAALMATNTTTGGQVTQYSYDSAGNLTKSVNPSGLTTTYTYDNLGRLTSQSDNCADCGTGLTTMTTTYAWDGLGNLLTETDPSTTDAVTGANHTRQIRVAYDNDGNETSQTVADTSGGDSPRTTSWTYNANNLVAQSTDPAGHSTTFGYDGYGNVTNKTDGAGTKWLYLWDALHHQQRTAITNYTGSPTNPVTSQTQVLESRAYDPAGRLATVTDAMGRTTHNYYNDDNTLAEVDLDGFHNADGSTRNVVLQQNTYDPAGQLIQQVTGGGKSTVTSSYDAASRLSSATLDPGGLGRTTAYTYDASDNVLTDVLSGSGESHETDYGYNALGQVITQTVKNQPADSVTKNTYDQRGLPLTTISPLGNVAGADPSAYTTTFTHDALGRLTTTTSPPVTSTTFNPATGSAVVLPQARSITRTGYGVFDNATSAQDPTGNITTFTRTYDSNGRHDSTSLNSYTAPGQTTAVTAVTQLDSDALDRVATVHDPLGRLTTNTYDQLGNLVETDAPAVNGTVPKVQYTYDLDGEKQSMADPVGAVTLATYDDLGRPITSSRQVRRAGQPTAVYTAAFGYDDAGNRTSVTTPGGSTGTFGYNAAGEQTSTTDPLTFTSTTSYNLLGQPTKATLPGNQPGSTGPSKTITYNEAGQATSSAQLSSTGSTLASTTTTYDVAGNAISATDADGNTTTATYDALGRPLQHIEPVASGKTITTAFGYDTAGRRTAYTDGNNNTTYYTFNTLGLPESTIEPATSAYPNLADRTYTTGYNILSQPATVAQPGGTTISNTFDPAGHLTTQTGTGGEAPAPTRTLGYDLDGRLTSLSTPGGTQNYTYEDRGPIATASGPTGNATYTYNANGQLASRADASGTAGFTYDADGHLKTLAEPQTGQTLVYNYTPRGQVSTVQYGNGNTRSYTYDDQGNLATDNLKSGSGATVSSLGYTYYPSGRLKTKATNGLAGAGTHTYTYDAAGRLSTWNNGRATTNYAYDGDGNLTTNGVTNSTYNQRNQLTGQGSNTYTYTARGTRSSVISGSTTTSSTYDAFDELTNQGGTTYSYDALGRLAQTSGHTLTYDGTTSNTTADGTETYSRTPGGNLIAIGAGGSASFALNDRHGDVVGTFAATDTSVANSRSYDPWGKPTATTGTNHNLGYQGGWTDSTTGQVSTASRWYDPSTSAFTSRDTTTLDPTTAAGANRYAYAAADPLNNADPSGHTSCEPSEPDPNPDSPPDSPPSIGHHRDWGADDYNDDYNPLWNSLSYQESSSNNEYNTMWGWADEYLAHYGIDGSAGYAQSAIVAAEVEAEVQAISMVEAETVGYALAAGYDECDTDQPVYHRHTATPRPKPAPKPKPVPTKIKPRDDNPNSENTQQASQLNGGHATGQTGVVATAGNPGAAATSFTIASESQSSALNSGVTSSSDRPRSCLDNRPSTAVTDGATGWINYGPVDTGGGGRSTGIEACVTGKPSGSRGTVASGDIVGFSEALNIAVAGGFSQSSNPIARCHLAPREFGGSGTDPRNLAPCFQRTANAGPLNSMRQFERHAGDALREGQIVDYEVMPVYASKTSTIPMGFSMMAYGQYANGEPDLMEYQWVWNSALNGQGQLVDLWN